MFIIKTKRFFKWFTFNWVSGITLFPFVLLRKQSAPYSKELVNHEMIHIRQQMELFVVVFFIWYGIEFLIRWMQYGNRFAAYQNISFEREAYENETNMSYLKNRRIWSFLQYI